VPSFAAIFATVKLWFLRITASAHFIFLWMHFQICLN
jgi:hypothetical protein